MQLAHFLISHPKTRHQTSHIAFFTYFWSHFSLQLSWFHLYLQCVKERERERKRERERERERERLCPPRPREMRVRGGQLRLRGRPLTQSSWNLDVKSLGDYWVTPPNNYAGEKWHTDAVAGYWSQWSTVKDKLTVVLFCVHNGSHSEWETKWKEGSLGDSVFWTYKRNRLQKFEPLQLMTFIWRKSSFSLTNQLSQLLPNVSLKQCIIVEIVPCNWLWSVLHTGPILHIQV